MSETVNNEAEMAVKTATPLWYWVVSGLGVAWSLMGANDYVMTKIKNEAYLGNIPEPLLEYFYSIPVFMTIFWALAVWGGLLGWILMLARSRFAVPAFILSFVCMIINFAYSFFDGGMALQAQYMGAGMTYGFTGLIVVGGIFAIWFSRRMRARGRLR